MSTPSPRPAPGIVTWVVGGILLTVLTAAVVGPRPAGYMLTLVVLGVFVARATLPPSLVHPFVIRSRWLDLTVMGVASVSLAVLTSVAPF